MSVKKYELIYFNLNGVVGDNDQGCKKRWASNNCHKNLGFDWKIVSLVEPFDKHLLSSIKNLQPKDKTMLLTNIYC